MSKVDVIIPVYKPGNKFKKLLIMLNKQTIKPSIPPNAYPANNSNGSPGTKGISI